MKKIDRGVVLAVAGAFALLVLLFVFNPLSCLSANK